MRANKKIRKEQLVLVFFVTLFCFYLSTMPSVKAATDTLYVNSFSSTDTTWIEYGSTPYLWDTDADYVNATLQNQVESWFAFADHTGSESINYVYLYVESSQNGDDGVVLSLQATGVTETQVGTITPNNGAYTWQYVDVSTILDTWEKINSTELKLSCSKSGPAFGEQSVRRAYLYVDYTSADSTPPQWSNPNVNVTNPHRGEPVNISALWQDSGVGLDMAWLSTNETDSWFNYTGGTYGSPRSLSGTDPVTVNFTWTNNTGSPRVIGWIMYANDTGDRENGTNNPSGVFEGNFTMWGWSNITWTSPDDGTYSPGSIVNLTCFVNDTNTTGSGPISGYDVYFYNETASTSSYLGVNYTNSSGYAVWSWNTTGLSAGEYYPKCNITDNSTLFYNASEYYQANTTIEIEVVEYRNVGQGISLSFSAPRSANFNRIETLSITPTASNIRTQSLSIFFPQTLSLDSAKIRIKSLLRTLIQSLDVVEIFDRLITVSKAFNQMLDISAIFKVLYSGIRGVTQSLQINDVIIRLRTVSKLLSQALNITDIITKLRTLPITISQSLQINTLVKKTQSLLRSITQSLALLTEITTEKITAVTKELISQAINISTISKRLALNIKAFSQALGLNEIATKIRSVLRALSQSIGLTDAIKIMTSISKNLSQSLGVTDIITKLKTVPKTISELININTVITRLYKSVRGLSQSLDILSVIERLRTVPKTLSQLLNIDILVSRVYSGFKTITQAIDITGIITRLRVVPKILSQAIDISEISKRTASILRKLGQLLDVNEIITRLRTIPKMLTQSVNVNNLIRKVYSGFRVLTQSFALNSAVVKIRTFLKALSQSMGIQTAIEKLRIMQRVISQSLQINTLTKTIQSISRTIAQSLTLIGEITKEVIREVTRRFISQSIDITGKIINLSALFKNIPQYLGIQDVIIKLKTIPKVLSQIIDITTVIERLRTVPRALSQALNVNAIITRIYNGFRALSQQLQITDVIEKLRFVSKTITQTLQVNGIILRFYSQLKTIAQGINISYIATRLTSLSRAISQSFSINVVISRLYGGFKIIAQSVDITGIMEKIKTLSKVIGQALGISDVISKLKSVPKLISQAIGITDVIEKISTLSRTIAQSFNMNDVIEKLRAVPRFLSETLNINEAIKRLYSSIQILSQSLSINTIATNLRAIFKRLSQSLTTNTVITRLVSILRQTSEYLTPTAAMARFSLITKLLSQSFSVSALSERVAGMLRALSQSLSTTGLVTRITSISRTISQSLLITTSAIGQRVIELYEKIASITIMISDITRRLLYASKTMTGSFAISDVLTRLTEISRAISQSLNISEFFTHTAFQLHERIVSVYFAISQLVQKSFAATRVVSQAINLNLITSRVASYFRNVFDVISFLFRLIFPCWIYPTQGSCEVAGCYWCSSACQSESCPGPTLTTTPPSEGGSAAPAFEIFVAGANFTIDKDFIKVLLNPGETGRGFIVISNTGETNLTITVDLRNLENFLVFPGGVSEYTFDLEVGKEKSIQLNFFASEEQELGVFPGKVVVTGNGIEKPITVVVEVESIKPMFDIDIEIPQKYKELLPGEDVLVQLIIYNIKRIGRVDVNVEYGIKDTEGNVLVSEQETLAVEMQVSIVRTLDVPYDIKPGNYVVYTIVKYDDTAGTGSDIFRVIPKKIEMEARITISLLVIITALITVIIIMNLYSRKQRVYGYKKDSIETIEKLRERMRKKRW